MTRTLKFRGWHDGYDGKTMLPPQDLSQSRSFWKWLGVNDVILMQYTGLFDKNGTEIYEGDIVKIDEIYPHHEIRWFGPNYPAFDLHPGLSFDEANGLSERTSDGVCDCEVIGNIHENPELLSPQENSQRQPG